MGNIYVKSYFPRGYCEFITNCKLNDDCIMEDEIYKEWILNKEIKDYVDELLGIYQENVALIKIGEKGIHELIAKNNNSDVSHNRIIYDTLVGHILCQFWKQLFDQSQSTINSFYTDNKPEVEPIFFQVEKEFNLERFGYPAIDTITAYKYYT
jgi:hypothetical protein